MRRKMNRIIGIYIYIFLFSCDLSIDSKKEEKLKSNQGILKIDEYNVIKGNPLGAKFWKCGHSVTPNFSICYPKIWKIENQNVYDFFSYIDTVEKDAFFVIASYDMGNIEISQDKFVKESYFTLSQDSIEFLKSSEISKLYFETSSSIYSVYDVSSQGRTYKIRSMTFENSNTLYDFTLKVENEESEKYDDLFKDILHNIKIKGSYHFENQGKLLQIEKINPSNL